MKRYLLLFLLIQLPLSASGVKEEYNIWFTASLNGNLEGCYCIDNPSAGLTITGKFLKNTPVKNDIIIDLGDRNSYPYNEKSASIIDTAYNYIGYDIALYGDQDFQPLLQRIKKHKPDWNNIPDNIVLNEYSSVEQEPVKLNGLLLLSIIDEKVFRFYPDEIRSHFTAIPPREYISEILETESSPLVLIFHGSYDSLRILLESLETNKIPVALFGHDQRLVEGVKIKNTYVYSPGPNGNNVGYVKIDNAAQITDYALYMFHYSQDDHEPVIQLMYEESLK